MLDAVGLGAAGALLLTLATLTTNFVNIYMSSLAWKSLAPGASDAAVIWSIGIVGTALSAVPGVWLEQYTELHDDPRRAARAGRRRAGRALLHSAAGHRNEAFIAELYDPAGAFRGVIVAGVDAWAAGSRRVLSRPDRSVARSRALVVSVVVYTCAAMNTAA